MNKRGFSLIELLVVMVVIGILAAIAIPAYMGFQNKARTSSVLKSAEGSIPDLQAWLQSSVSTAVTNIDIDTNFDGKINENDKTNQQLLNDGVAATYTNGKNNILGENSPWFPGTPLWSVDPSIPNGRISLIQLSNSKIRMVTKDKEGTIIFEKFIFAD